MKKMQVFFGSCAFATAMMVGGMAVGAKEEAGGENFWEKMKANAINTSIDRIKRGIRDLDQKIKEKEEELENSKAGLENIKASFPDPLLLSYRKRVDDEQNFFTKKHLELGIMTKMSEAYYNIVRAGLGMRLKSLQKESKESTENNRYYNAMNEGKMNAGKRIPIEEELRILRVDRARLGEQLKKCVKSPTLEEASDKTEEEKMTEDYLSDGFDDEDFFDGYEADDENSSDDLLSDEEGVVPSTPIKKGEEEALDDASNKIKMAFKAMAARKLVEDLRAQRQAEKDKIFQTEQAEYIQRAFRCWKARKALEAVKDEEAAKRKEAIKGYAATIIQSIFKIGPAKKALKDLKEKEIKKQEEIQLKNISADNFFERNFFERNFFRRIYSLACFMGWVNSFGNAKTREKILDGALKRNNMTKELDGGTAEGIQYPYKTFGD